MMLTFLGEPEYLLICELCGLMAFAVSEKTYSRIDMQLNPAIERFDDILPSQYETVAFVGRGSFSEVWKVRENSSGHFFALKCLRTDKKLQPVASRLLDIEATVTKNCESPFVIKLVEKHLECKQPYLLLEWLDGQSLQQMINDSGRFSLSRSLWIARQCALSLEELRQAGFTHGDLKPDNIFLSPAGSIKLIDFGFSRSIRTEKIHSSSGYLSGTADYLAPEVLSRESFNPISQDMYSLGVILFQMLAGRLPFEADSVVEVLKLHRQARPPMLRRYCPEAPREVAELVNRLLAKQPIRRPSTLKSLIRELISLELPTMLAASQ